MLQFLLTGFPTVAIETLEGMFLVNNSPNTQHRAPKPLAIDFYWAAWHLNFFYLFALSSTMTYFFLHKTYGIGFFGQYACPAKENITILSFPFSKIQKVVIQETSIKNKFFEYPLSITLGKSKIPIGKGHTGNSTSWFGVRSLWFAY